MVKIIPDKVPIGRIKKDLVDKSKQYKELTGVKTVPLVESLLEDFFKDKILENDFIDLPKPYYFNMNELRTEGIVKATSVKPIKDLEKTYVLFNVPNNLDSWNTERNSYSFEDNPDLHRGYYYYMDLILDLVFNYNSSTEELEIAVSHDRDIYFTSEQKEEKEKLVTEREIYVPELELNVIVGYEGLNMLSYPEYKYYVLERAEREKEELRHIEEIERQEEEFYKNQ